MKLTLTILPIILAGLTIFLGLYQELFADEIREWLVKKVELTRFSGQW